LEDIHERRRILLKIKEDRIGTAWSWIKIEPDAGFVNIANKFQVPNKQRNFLTRWANINLSSISASSN